MYSIIQGQEVSSSEKEVILRVENLRKTFNGKEILKNINFTVKNNSIHALLGPNGAGKTTTIKCILGLYNYQGKILYKNYLLTKDSKYIIKEISHIPEIPYLPRKYKVKDIINIFSSIFNVESFYIEQLLTELNLSEHLNKNIEKLSKGLKKRLSILLAFLKRPKFMILDEPFTGLDIDYILWLKKKIKNDVENKIYSVLITSHLLAEISDLVDTVSFIFNGKTSETINFKSIKEIQNELKYELIFENTNKLEIILPELKKNFHVLKIQNSSITLLISKDEINKLYEIFSSWKIYPMEIILLKKDLYELYKTYKEIKGDKNQ